MNYCLYLNSICKRSEIESDRDICENPLYRSCKFYRELTSNLEELIETGKLDDIMFEEDDLS